MKFPTLFKKEVKDDYVKQNFQAIQDYFKGNTLDKCDFVFLQITSTGAVTANYAHNLGFKPSDVMIMAVTNGVTATVNYDSMTATYVSITTSAAATIRMLIGKYNNG